MIDSVFLTNRWIVDPNDELTDAIILDTENGDCVLELETRGSAEVLQYICDLHNAALDKTGK